MTMTAEAPQATPDEIVAAAKALRRVCDGAVAEDGHGYNGVDARLMHGLVDRGGPYTDRQVRLMWHVLRKYRRQLENHGVEYTDLVPPPLAPRDATGKFVQQVRRLKLEWVDTKYGRRIALVFGYNVDLVNVARGLEKRWWDGEAKRWLIPDDVDHLDVALGAFEALEPEVEIEVAPDLKESSDRERQKRRKNLEASRAATSDFVAPTLIPLKPFQNAGVEYIDAHGGRALVGDDMGLGKTAQAIGWVTLRREKALPALVVCPAVVRINWAREVVRFAGLKPLVIVSKSALKNMTKLCLPMGIDVATEPKPGYDVVILNPDLFEAQTPKTWVKALVRGDNSVVQDLLAAGQYAMNALVKAKAKAHPSVLPQIMNVIQRIQAQGAGSNKKKYIKCFVNELALDQFLALFNPATVIADESHYYKEADAQRTMVVTVISQKLPHAIWMTGTPLLNRPREIWSQVHAIDPTIFPSFFTYAKEFCAAHQNRFGWDFSGASNVDKLSRILRERVMIRREKLEVLKELPPCQRSTIPIALNGHLKEYEKEAKESIVALASLKASRDEWKKTMAAMSDDERREYLAKHAEDVSKSAKLTGHIINEITKLRKIAALAKVEPAMDFILDSVEQAGKIIVFAHHHDAVDAYVARLHDAEIRVVKVDGREDAAARQRAIDLFQEGDAQVIVIGIQAGGAGLNLQKASNVIFVELPWRPGDVDQAIARAWRMGQENRVTAYFLVGLGTIEEKMARLIDSKREVVNAVVGETDRTIEEDGIMDALLAEIVPS